MRELKRELRRGEAGTGYPGKSHGLVRKGERIDPQRGFWLVSDHQAVYPVHTMCRLLGLSPSGY